MFAGREIIDAELTLYTGGQDKIIEGPSIEEDGLLQDKEVKLSLDVQ